MVLGSNIWKFTQLKDGSWLFCSSEKLRSKTNMTFLQRESTKFWCCVHLICGSGGLTMLFSICTNPSELQNFPVCLPRLCLLRDVILNKVYFPQNLINFLYSFSSPIIYDYFLYFGTIRYFSLGKKVLLFVKNKTNKNRTNKQKSTPAYIVVFV